MSLRIKEFIIICIFSILGMMMTYAFMNHDYSNTGWSIGANQGYDFNTPATTIQLPKILHEVSGLTDIDNNTLACIQDEEGIVFVYDWRKEKIIRQIKFGKGGDYEGVTRVKNSIFILRSDGKLFEIENFESEDFKLNEYDTDIPVKDNEGLGFDANQNCLLIAGKSEPKDDEYKDSRVVYAFDLTSKSMKKGPTYIFTEKSIKQFVQKNKKDLPPKKTGKDLKIHPSAIAVHPVTARLFVLSSKDKLVYIFNQENVLEAVHQLDKKIHQQPEGITFLKNGDMFISNEGAEEEPLLLYFPMQ